MTLAAFIAKWRESHKEGQHESECCVNDLLDELERLEDAKSPVAAAKVKCANCGKQASFIINRRALCEECRRV